MTQSRLNGPDTWDDDVRTLRRVLDAFDGIETFTSSSDHPQRFGSETTPRRWRVSFRIERTDDSWFALEFLAWAVNNDLVRGGRKVELYPFSPPPYLNEPGQMLVFTIEGESDPKDVADFISRMYVESYISPAQLAAEEDDEDEDE